MEITIREVLIAINAIIGFYGAWVCSRITWYPPSTNTARNMLSLITFQMIGAVYFTLGILHSVRLFQLAAGMTEYFVVSSTIREIIATAFSMFVVLFLSTTFNGKLQEIYQKDVSKTLLERPDE